MSDFFSISHLQKLEQFIYLSFVRLVCMVFSALCLYPSLFLSRSLSVGLFALQARWVDYCRMRGVLMKFSGCFVIIIPFSFYYYFRFVSLGFAYPFATFHLMDWNIALRFVSCCCCFFGGLSPIPAPLNGFNFIKRCHFFVCWNSNRKIWMKSHIHSFVFIGLARWKRVQGGIDSCSLVDHVSIFKAFPYLWHQIKSHSIQFNSCQTEDKRNLNLGNKKKSFCIHIGLNIYYVYR